jgi:curved DNA-binding protein CbpA
MTVSEALEVFNIRGTLSSDAVKKLYHKLAREYHPDLGGSPQKMQQLNDAYKVLYEHLRSKEAAGMYKKRSHIVSARSFFITKDPQNFEI